MNDETRAPIIIKRIKKVAGGHHGGAWKIAYADFVTAMMAFFLLMWLLGSDGRGRPQGHRGVLPNAAAGCDGGRIGLRRRLERHPRRRRRLDAQRGSGSSGHPSRRAAQTINLQAARAELARQEAESSKGSSGVSRKRFRATRSSRSSRTRFGSPSRPKVYRSPSSTSRIVRCSIPAEPR